MLIVAALMVTAVLVLLASLGLAAVLVVARPIIAAAVRWSQGGTAVKAPGCGQPRPPHRGGS
jgi:hypothetical protein